MRKQHPIACQLIQMWRWDTVTSVGMERFNPQVVGKDEDDIGFVVSRMTL
jgi:hypothetical protein